MKINILLNHTFDMRSRNRHKWTRSDTVLALELYCTVPQKEVTIDHPRLVELAHVIDITPGSLYMKLQNFKSCDPSYTVDGKKGLPNITTLDREITAKFLHNQSELAAEAEKIRKELGLVNTKKERPY